MGPWYASPLKERDYTGDLGFEAKLYSLATGDEKSMEELDLVAERIFNLHRALTIRDMGTKEMRAQHDTIPPWVFDYPADKAPFTPGHYKMDRRTWKWPRTCSTRNWAGTARPVPDPLHLRAVGTKGRGRRPGSQGTSVVSPGGSPSRARGEAGATAGLAPKGWINIAAPVSSHVHSRFHYLARAAQRCAGPGDMAPVLYSP